MSTEMQDLLIEEHSIVGVRATGVHGGVEIRATLTVAADGRDSRLWRKAELVPIETGVPIDVLWFHLPEPQDPPPGPASSGSAMPPTRCHPSSAWAFAHRNLTRVMRASGDRLVPRPVVRGAAGAGDPRPASPGEADRPRLPLGTTGPGWGCKHGRRG